MRIIRNSRLFICGSILLLGIMTLPKLAVAANMTSSGDVTVTALVPTPPPSTPPTIDSPVSGDTFTTPHIQVSGSCVSFLIVKVFDDNQFVGSILCDSGGNYSLSVDIAVGQSELVARQYDALDQASPASNTVMISYSPPQILATPPQAAQPSSTANSGLSIAYNYASQGAVAGQSYSLPVHFVGGSAPYAVNIDWGDGQTSLFSRKDTQLFAVDHIYTNAGVYTVAITVSDANGSQARIQFILIVSGTPTLGIVHTPFGNVQMIAPLWGLIVALIIVCLCGFGLGLAFGHHIYKHYKKRKTDKAVRREAGVKH